MFLNGIVISVSVNTFLKQHAHIVKAQNWELLIPISGWSKLDLLVTHKTKRSETRCEYGTRYSKMEQQNLWKTTFEGVWSSLGRPYPFKFFKGCLLQILLGPFLNTLAQMYGNKAKVGEHSLALLRTLHSK